MRRLNLAVALAFVASLAGSAWLLAQSATEAATQLQAEQIQEAKGADFWLSVFRWFGANPWAWKLTAAFLIYQFIGGSILAVFQVKFGDRHTRQDLSVGLLFVWEFLSKTCFDVVGVIRAILCAVLPNWIQRAPGIAAILGLSPKQQPSLGLSEP